jgi:hypothetical protein
MKMWSCFDTLSIRERIQKTVDDSLMWTFWQSEVKGKYKFVGRIVELEEDKLSISLSVGSLENLFKGEAIYGHCDKLDIVFKREKFDIKDDFLFVPLPNELKIKDSRIIERLYYKYQDYKATTFNCYLGEKHLTLSYIMSDLSTKGISFVAPKKEVLDFKPGMEISITHVSDQQLEENIQAKIMYLAPFGEEQFFKSESELGKLMKIGAQFDEGLDEITFKTVSSVIEIKQTKMAGLDVPGFNGLKQEEIDRKIAFISEADPKLGVSIADNIEEIERLRFLTPKMKQIFWTEVDRNVLSQALRISSKELLYDLLSDVSENVRMDFLESLDKQFPAGAIEKAQTLIIKFIHEKERAGEFVLSPDSFIQYV